MSIAAFQRALAELIASPELCLRVRDDPACILDRYELDSRELRRVRSVVAQRGMSTNCSLYRQNRVTPVFTHLNRTCLLLGDALVRELDLYWSVARFEDAQFILEIQRFAAQLRARIEAGRVAIDYLLDVLNFEVAWAELEFEVESPATTQHPAVSPVRFVTFHCAPWPLLDSLEKCGCAPSRPPPIGRYGGTLHNSDHGVAVAWTPLAMADPLQGADIASVGSAFGHPSM